MSKMDALTAIEILEGIALAESEEQYLEAAQYLVDTDLAWCLQGYFGRLCADLIDRGYIQEKQ